MRWDQAPELNARFEVRRALPEHYENSELALDPTEAVKFVAQPLQTARNNAGAHSFGVLITVAATYVDSLMRRSSRCAFLVGILPGLVL